MPAPLTLGTAGHIDHGKTVLVEALTAINTDRLPEARARDIAIELGLAARELLAEGPYEEAEVVSVSARAGVGLERLVEALDRAAALPPREAEHEPARLHVDRCFSLHGVGTVVTGTLWCGALGAGEEIRIE